MDKFLVPDMSCGHCEKSIKKALTDVKEQVKIEVDLAHKVITVENMEAQEVIQILDKIGFSATKV